jgi:hypothetical protein
MPTPCTTPRHSAPHSPGMLEFGTFGAALEDAAAAAGIPLSGDSAPLIAFADALPAEQLRDMCSVRRWARCDAHLL